MRWELCVENCARLSDDLPKDESSINTSSVAQRAIIRGEVSTQQLAQLSYASSCGGWMSQLFALFWFGFQAPFSEGVFVAKHMESPEKQKEAKRTPT